jgi:hypothetical protein
MIAPVEKVPVAVRDRIGAPAKLPEAGAAGKSPLIFSVFCVYCIL